MFDWRNWDRVAQVYNEVNNKMASITPSNTQKRAIDAIKHWYQNDTDKQQVFRLFGYAGVGKSTVLKFALEELDLEPHRPGKNGDECTPGVVTATFTGKAALVLRRKGTMARTIHSLIYSVIESTEEEVNEFAGKIVQAQEGLRGLFGDERYAAEAAVVAMRRQLAWMKQPRYALNPMSDAAECKLIVLDEVSMVDEYMAADLMSFGKPILVLGDPGQLPPIRGQGAFTQAQPDVMLTEIHRQAQESPIIRLATMAREGAWIPYGQYDGHVAKMRKTELGVQHLLKADQVICGKNATRLQLNNDMRLASGYSHDAIPTGNGEKIICLKNQNDIGLINGMFLTLDDIIDEEDRFFSAVVTDDEGRVVGKSKRNGAPPRHKIYKGHFLDHAAFDPDRHDKDWQVKKILTEATFGWAITCHKAQGSQWNNVIVWDDGLGRSEIDRRQWLYTALTRAEQGLVLLQ